MNLRSMAIVALACCTGTYAQDADQVRSNARKYVKNLTAPALQGRGYVQNGDGLAADWIAQQYVNLGLKPLKNDHFQRFQFAVNSFPDSMRVSLDGTLLAPGVDYLVNPASGSANGTFDLVHLNPEDLLDPARRAMAMGVLNGNAACLHFPITTNADTLRRYEEVERELMTATSMGCFRVR